MTRRALIAFLVACAALCALCAAPARSAPSSVASEHYELDSEGPEDECREFSRVLEAAWPQFLAFFGTPPKLAKGERLRVRFFETAAAMKAAIVAGGGAAPDSGGYYCPVARTSYAFRQPTRWYTRTLLLHEVAHQFHLRGAATQTRGPPPGWWTEGIAEHLSHHTWDGTTLRLGVVPPVSLEDRSGAALAAALAKDFVPERILDEPMDRPRSMHLVRFLATAGGEKGAARWRDLAKTLDRGENLKPKDLDRGYANAAAFRARFVEWLGTVQQPLLSVFVEWDSTGEAAVRGRSASVCVCRTRGDAVSVEARAEPSDPEKPSRVGVLLEFDGPSDYVVGEILDGKTVRVDRLRGGAWDALHQGPVPDGLGAAPWRVAAVRDGGNVTFRIGDADVYSFASHPGPLGLCVDACAADFREIRIR